MHKLFKSIFIFLIAISMLLPLTACGESKVKIPDIDELITDENFDGYKDVEGWTKEAVFDKWGEPDWERGVTCIWKSGHRYVRVSFEDNGDVIEANISQTMRASIVEINEYEAPLLIEPIEGDPARQASDCIFFSPEWLPENTVPALGMILEIEFDGMFMMTYPCQISEPYDVRVVQSIE